MADPPQQPAAPAGLAAVASELYGLPFHEFTAARNERVKLARSGGDRDLAAAIGKLPKPTLAGWLANQLVRAHPAQIDALLRLGGAMRQATAALDAAALRELSGQQHQQLAALVRLAGDLAAGSGHSFSDSTARALQDTLHAALADEQAGQELRLGQLAAGLSHSGFPGVSAAVPASAWAPAPARTAGGRPAARPRDKSSLDQAALLRAEAERAGQAEAQAQARDEVSQASQARERAVAGLAKAEQAATAAAELVTSLRAQLAGAIAAQAEADRAHKRAAKTAEVAANSARHAERRLREGTAKRESLDGQAASAEAEPPGS